MLVWARTTISSTLGGDFDGVRSKGSNPSLAHIAACACTDGSVHCALVVVQATTAATTAAAIAAAEAVAAAIAAPTTAAATAAVIVQVRFT